MKTYITYIVILIAGLFIGWLVFGGSNNTAKMSDHEHSSNENTMWTCSMHPQIMQPEAGDCPICGMDLIPAEAGADGLSPDQFKMTENAIALANIETTIVGTSHDENSNSLTLSGKIMTNDNATALQTAHFGGRIEKLFFKSKGDYVENGALIASIYSPELVTAQNELIEALEIKEAQPELYEAVRKKLQFWKISEKQIQDIERNKKVISNFNMYANTNGYIEEVLVQEGHHVKEGSPLFKVANLKTVWANLDVYENDIKNLKTGQLITITLNAYPDKQIESKIDYIDPTINKNTRTVTVRTTLNNKENLFKPGMLINGIVNLDATSHTALSIPKSAVMWTGKRSIVYVKSSKTEPVFEMREVQLGNATSAYYNVISGIENGEEIVTNGTFTVDAAAQLQGKRSMMNQEEKEQNPEEEKVTRFNVSSNFQTQLKAVFDNYILLKNALVQSDNTAATSSSKSFEKSLTKVDMTLLKEQKAHEFWMEALKEIKLSISGIINTNTLETQRKHFKPLSQHFTNAVMAFGINQTVYSQFCPMADNDTGGYWLSLEEEIRNPYFGDAMLKCGTVEETIK